MPEALRCSTALSLNSSASVSWCRVDDGEVVQLDLFHAGHAAHSTDEARCPACGEQLLGVRAAPRAPERLGYGEIDVQHAVVGRRAPSVAALRGGGGDRG